MAFRFLLLLKLINDCNQLLRIDKLVYIMKMSSSKNDKNSPNSSIKTDRSHKLPDHLLNKKPSQTSLFSEIMRNHSGQSTPVEKYHKKDSIMFDVKDVPLPPLTNIRNSTKSDNPRKRSSDNKEDIALKKRRQYDPKPENQRLKKELFTTPTICKRRTHIRQGSTWGERSVKAFKILSEVGEGTYGHVFKAVDRLTNKVKALKKVRLENEREGFPITTVREIKILQQLNHPNIVRLHEVVTDYDLCDSAPRESMVKDKGFYLVFEYMDHDLYGIIDSKISLSELQVASITKQILEGINYSHKKMFLHRDIKCSNILINNKGEVKIADYGLSRRFYADNVKRPYTNKVITLWYRAPELLLGEECYGTSIDMWSIGCIIGELFTHKTMFTSNTEMDQMDAIARICGTPSPLVWPEVAKLPLYQSYRPKYTNKRCLLEEYKTLPKDALEVLNWLLQLDPKRRCSADQALRSYWLSEVDPRKIAPPQFPTDGDYHELSCKRRQKQNRSDTGYKSSAKSSVKVQQSTESSTGASEQDSAVTNGVSAAAAFELPDDMLAVLNEELHHLLPDADKIRELVAAASSSSTSAGGVGHTLELLLEPYIKQMLLSKQQQMPCLSRTNEHEDSRRLS